MPDFMTKVLSIESLGKGFIQKYLLDL